MQLPGIMVPRATMAGRADDWSELMKSDELKPWMMAKLKRPATRQIRMMISTSALCSRLRRRALIS